MPAPAPTPADLLDALVVGVPIYAVPRGMRQGKGGFARTGITLLFPAASTLGLRHVTVLFKGFFTVLLVALVVNSGTSCGSSS